MADLWNCEFSELVHVVPANAPVDSHTAGVTGLWASMKDYGAAVIQVEYAVGTASDEVAITLNQATSSGGAGSKALTFTKIRKIVASTAIGQSTVDTDTIVTQAAATSYTPTGESAKQAQYLIQIGANDLDVNNGFFWFQATIGTPGNARLCSLNYLMFRCHHPQNIPNGCFQ